MGYNDGVIQGSEKLLWIRDYKTREWTLINVDSIQSITLEDNERHLENE